MKRVGFILALLFTSSAFGWSGYTHRLLVIESLREVAQEWGLNQPVERTPFENFLVQFSKNHPEVQTREDFARWLQINPEAPFDRPSRAERPRKTLTPLEILGLYAPRADDGRDMNLPCDRLEQFWFGSGTIIGARVAPSSSKAAGASPSRSLAKPAGGGSQAFRHMEKPAFNPLHPLNTFGFPPGSIGQASRRAQIYFDLAVEAYRLGEPYWAWNFLGVGLHYIEDLGNPYHTAHLLPPLLTKGLAAYKEWGYRQKRAWIPTLTHIVSNAHHYFEGTVDHLLLEEEGGKWKQALHGTSMTKDTPFHLAKQVRDHANTFAVEAVEATFRITGSSLLTPAVYDTWVAESEHPEDPRPYLTKNESEHIQGTKQIDRIVTSVFQQQGMVIRGVVKGFLEAVQ